MLLKLKIIVMETKCQVDVEFCLQWMRTPGKLCNTYVHLNYKHFSKISNNLAYLHTVMLIERIHSRLHHNQRWNSGTVVLLCRLHLRPILVRNDTAPKKNPSETMNKNIPHPLNLTTVTTDARMMVCCVSYRSISDGVIGPHRMWKQFRQMFPCEYGFIACWPPFELNEPFICNGDGVVREWYLHYKVGSVRGMRRHLFPRYLHLHSLFDHL